MAFGFVAIAVGALWALQGAGVVPGSVMSGDPMWLVIGVITSAGGAAIMLVAARKARN